MDSTSNLDLRGVDRRSVLRWGALLAGGVGVSGLVSACSSGLPDDEPSAGGAAGSPTTSQPKDVYSASVKAGEKSPLAHQLGLALVTLQGAIQQFADAASSTAEEDRLDVSQAVNDGNTGKAISQLTSFLQRDVGALMIQDLTPSAQVPVIKQAIDKGVATFAFNMPSSLQLTASQYDVGRRLAEGTLAHINKHMDDKAELVHLNFDYNPAVAPRDQGWRDVMKGRPPGVRIVADVPVNPETQEKGNAVMASILQKTPTVNVVDGGDTGVLGALSALRAAGRGSDPDLALFGVNGDPQAVAEVKAGGPYKATYAFNFAILGVLVSDMADRWLDGLNIPQLALVTAVAIDSPDAIAAYNASVADPASAYESAVGTYFDLYGSTSYATRGSYYDGTVT